MLINLYKDVNVFFLQNTTGRIQSCPGVFHGHLVELYADYAPSKLLAFLQTSDQYPIQDALGDKSYFSSISLGRLEPEVV